MMFSILRTDQFTSLAGLWVCSNERAPTTPLQQSIRGIIESPPFLSWRARVRALEDPWVHIHLSFVCTLCHLLCCFFLLLFLTWTFANIFELHHSMCSMLFFFSQKEYPPTWPSIPSHKHTLTTPKIRLLKTILEFLLHNLPIVVVIFWTIFSSLSSFFLALFLLLFFHDFLTTRKENLPNLSPLFNFRVCSSPLSDTMAHMLSISFQLRHGIERSHSYIS